MHKTITFALATALAFGIGCETTPDEQDDQPEQAQAVQAQQAAEQPGEQHQEGQPAGDAEDPALQQETDDEPPPVRDWSEEGLEEQPRMEALRERTDGSADTTPWEESRHEVPEHLADPDTGEGADSPGDLLVELSAEYRYFDQLSTETWEQTMRVLRVEGDQTTGVILRWGLKDDAVAGDDLRVKMQLHDDAWYVEQLDQRSHCRRGVSDDGLCL